ncbi:MAG: trimethylamine methyltransferase family protein [Hyphomicrobiales bacterium]|nr:trimethylamine methyltransferase family protein [Hyphomicrobiales bacterium]
MTGARRGRRGKDAVAQRREVDYRRLRNPFIPQTVFSEDSVEAIHQTALRVLEELGMKVLLPDARRRFRLSGALVDEDTMIVRIGRDIVEAALRSAPRAFAVRGGLKERDVPIELGALTFQVGAGSPNTTDIVRGRRPSTLRDFADLVRITQHYDALQMLSLGVEAQDVPTHLRHYAVLRAQLTLSDKVPYAFARSAMQARDCHEMIRIVRGASEDEFRATPYCMTVINTNSPRQLDIPMAQGIIDFAEAGQPSIVTPFCLMGAMAPVTVAGALTLSHAEALAGIALSQIARPGAPVCYGAFASNVDMRSGAPAFGTPEEVKANIGAGQLARRLGLPWRCAAGCAANVNDAQAAHETEMSAWGSVLAGATIVKHAAGWLEGGLTVSFEKLITDIEMVQTFAELCLETPADDGAIAFAALAEVPPGGHFFAAAHTMERYQTAFYEPIVADWSNFGKWTERGARDATQRAHDIWTRIVNEFSPPPIDAARIEELDAFIAKRTEAGGAPPVS